MKREMELLKSPPKLVEMDHPYAEILARGNMEFATSPEESERFYRTRASVSPRPRRGATLLTPVALAAAVLLALALGVIARSPLVSKRATDQAAPQASTTLPPAGAPTGRLGADALVELGTGERKLGDGSVVNLQPGGSARLRDRGKATSVVLERGKVSLSVEPRAKDAELEVSAGAYRFKVIGTRFSVTRADDAIELRVDEGRVAVFGEKGQLATVAAGGGWSSADPTHPVPTTTSSAPEAAPLRRTERSPETSPASKAAPEPPVDCRELARSGESRKAEACYLERSSGGGLDAEAALLEVARLRRDVFDDPAGSLQALESYRKRFPNGSLRGEADIARVVLLTRLGRPNEALAESERLLDSPHGRERAFELRMLRGNVYRKGLGNTALAAREFAQAEKLDGASSEATYFLGTCLEELGDAAGAAAAYRRYLQKTPKGKRASEVRGRLERQAP